MKANIFKRLIQLIPMLFVISIVSFMLMHMAPGDPSISYITQDMNVVEIEEVKERLGLNEPIYIQYLKWVKNIIKGDMGYSLINHTPVAKMIKERIPATLSLMGSSLLLSLLISVPLGLYIGKNKNRLLDNILSVISYTGISIPSFWFGIMLIYFFSFKLGWLPSVGMRSLEGENSILDIIKHGILPCTVLTFYNVSVYTRYIRSSTISELNENYVRTEEAYGFSSKKIMLKYVFKNVLIPIITILGMNLPSILTGAFVTETVFSWPGMGRLGIDSIFQYDYPVVMATTMITSIMLVLGNLLADILYSVVDPRIKYRRL